METKLHVSMVLKLQEVHKQEKGITNTTFSKIIFFYKAKCYSMGRNWLCLCPKANIKIKDVGLKESKGRFVKIQTLSIQH